MRVLTALILCLAVIGLSWRPSAHPAPEAHGDGCIALVINVPGGTPLFQCLNFPDSCDQCFQAGGDEGMSCWCSPIGPYPNCCHLTYFPNNPPATNTSVSGVCNAAGCDDPQGICMEGGRTSSAGQTSHFALCKASQQCGGCGGF